ncbi:oligosaccharide flippase family protein [Virgibacillus kimchii]
MAIVAIVTPVAALTYPTAIVLPKSDGNAKRLIRLSLYITTGIASVAGLILLFFNQQIVKVFQLEDVASFLYLIPLVILFAGLFQVTEQWLIRTKQFGINAKVAFLQALFLNGSKVGIGLYYPIAAVLIILSALSNGFKALMMIIFSEMSYYEQKNDLQEKLLSVKELGKKHKDFPLFRAPQEFLNAISESIPILMLTTFFGPTSAGFYSIGRTVLTVPTLHIGKSVGDVFYPRISEAANNGENLSKLIKKATVSLGLIGLIPFGLIVIFGPWLFGFIFGEEWITAGEYARWMALWMFFMFINRPSVKSFPVLSAQAFHLKFTIFMLITRAAALAIGYYVFSSDLVAVAFFGISGAILNICLILITNQLSKRRV